MVYDISRDQGQWEDREILDSKVIVQLRLPFPIQLGCTVTCSHETELNGLIVLLKQLGRAAERTLGFLDSQGVLSGCHGILSAYLDNTIDMTPRGLRGLRGATLWQRLVKLIKQTSSFGVIGLKRSRQARPDQLAAIMNAWPRYSSEGLLMFAPSTVHIGGLRLAWIRGHQTMEQPTPCKAAVSLNNRADREAGAAAHTVISCDRKPHRWAPGVVKIPAGTSPIRVLYRGAALDGDVGGVLRALCVKGIWEDIGSKPGAVRDLIHSADTWMRLASPTMFRRVRVEERWHDLSESLYSIWLGYSGRLDCKLEFREHRHQLSTQCPLCGEVYQKYSTSHAMAWCVNETMVENRMQLLYQVNEVLRNARFHWPARDGNSTRRADRPTGVSRAKLPDKRWSMLRRAGLFLLDGDMRTLRGIPQAAIAGWLRLGKHRVSDKEISQMEVVGIYTEIIAITAVKGEQLLEIYGDLVGQKLGIREGDAGAGQAAENSEEGRQF